MDDSYAEFVKDGEITYSKKVDSLAVYAGKNRVKISFVNLGPRVTKVKIFWNLKSQSLELPVPAANRNLNVIIPDLAEGTYSFDVITYDNSGNVSVGTTLIGNVYGEGYSNTLRVRAVQGANVIKEMGSVSWLTAPAGALATEIKYTDIAEVAKVIYAPFNQSLTVLPNFKEGRAITYRTQFLPEPNAIDTFYTAALTRTIVQVPVRLDRTLFANVKLPNDKWQPNGGNPNWVLEKAWDGITNNDGVLFHAARTNFPATVTIDLGKLNKLTSMKVWGRTAAADLFNKGNLKEFEVYGRATAPVLTDGTMTGWTKIMTGRSAKPSGSALGTHTPADLAYAQAGEEYFFNANAPAVRYIRLNVLDSWGPPADNYWYFTELAFWGYEQ
jgi:hypothetical protein